MIIGLAGSKNRRIGADAILTDRTIGRAFGTLRRLSVVCDVLYCGKMVRPNQKLSEIGNHGQKVDVLGRRHISTSGFAGTDPIDGRFCIIFARTAQQSVLNGTNGLSSSKPCAYCRIELKPEVVLATIIDQETCK